MEVLLLQDIPGVGKKNDLLVVGNGFALNYLLPNRSALVATPLVRRRYAEFIKRRAEEKEREKAVASDVATMIRGKTVTVTAKVSKSGKLYASVNEEHIASLLGEQLGAKVSPETIRLSEHLKSTGSFPLNVHMGDHIIPFTVLIEAEKEGKKTMKTKETKKKKAA